MGTIADKLSYLNGTKTLLRRGINALGGALTTDDTFRSYANALDNIYDYLPKVTGTGTSVTLDGVRDGGLRINLNPTAIEQTTYTGKNKLAYTLTQLQTINTSGTWNNNIYTYNGVIYTINDDLTISTSGSASSTSYLYINNSLSLDTDTNYILNGSPTGGAYNKYSIRLYTDTQYVSDVGAGKDFTFGSQDAIRINFYNGTDASNLTFSPMVRLASVSDSTYEPYVGGTASPNPSYPQDIHTISGNNSIKIEGKNLIYEYHKSGNIIYFNGATRYESYIFKAGTYTFSYKGTNTCLLSIKDTAGTQTGLGNEKVITFTSNYDFNIWLYRSGITLEEVSEIMLEKGSTATTYTPYVSQTAPINLGEYELGTIGNYSNEFVRSDGENYFDASAITNSSFEVSNNGGTIKLPLTTSSSSSQNGYRSTSQTLKELCPNLKVGDIVYLYCDTNYNTINKYIQLNTTPSQLWNFGTSKTITQADLDSIFAFYSNRYNSGETNQLILTDFRITKIANASFVPYEKGWYYKQGIGKVVLDGTQNITSCNVSSGNSDMAYAYTTLLDNYIGSSDGVCDKLTKSNVELKSSTNSNNEMFSLSASTWGGLRFYFDKTRLSEVSVAGFKTWLSTNNITIYYTLNTPTYTKITGELAQELEQVYKGMLSYDGTTNISQVNNDLPFDLDIIALKELEESEG